MDSAPAHWPDIDPGRTFAVVVGVERYEAGSGWDIAGPAADASRFAQWLLTRGIPAEQIAILLSALDGSPGLLGPGLRIRRPDRQAVTDIMLRELPHAAGDLLIVMWAGHGVVEAGHSRRLFYADATEDDRRNLDIDSLLVTLGSDLLPSFNRQVWLIEACQQFADRFQLARTTPAETFPVGRPVPGREQFVLFAASPGQRAMGRAARQSGIFSHELLEILTSSAGQRWPPDPGTLATAVRARFADLRAIGRTDQTPTYLWLRNPLDGREEQVLRAAPATIPEWPPPALPLPLLRDLTDALLAIPEFAGTQSRERVLELIRGDIVAAMPRSPAARLDTVGIIRTCHRFAGGLSELREAVRFFAYGTPAMGHLDRVIAQVAGPSAGSGQA